MKIIARIYQFILKMGVKVIPYKKVKVIKGENSILKIKDVLIDNNINNVFIINGRTITKLGLLNPLIKLLDESQIKYTFYNKVSSDPTIDNILDCTNEYIKCEAQAIVAIGGGSILDCAKIANAKKVLVNKSIKDMRGIMKIHHKLPILIGVPTTAGTGSEVTLAAVVSDPNNKEKYAISDPCLICDYAILDPNLTLGLNPQLTSITGMDALSHSIEAYIGNSNTKQTKKDAFESINLIFDNLLIAYHDGSNIIARENMLYASLLAGQAFTKAYVGYVHAFAHAIGAYYHLPHGLAIAIVMPHILNSYGNKLEHKFDDFKMDHQTFINKIEMLNQEMNIPQYIEQIDLKDLDDLSNHIIKEANLLYPVPKIYNKTEIINLLKKIKGENHG
ncbi:MAG: iron-containing alcohol dehydrogenase [Erysipelotrichaceae bacterium]